MSMRSTPRPRRYVSRVALTICRPLLAYDDWRDAYVLRTVGERHGPVLRVDRRSPSTSRYRGPERRGDAATASGRRIFPV